MNLFIFLINIKYKNYRFMLSTMGKKKYFLYITLWPNDILYAFL